MRRFRFLLKIVIALSALILVGLGYLYFDSHPLAFKPAATAAATAEPTMQASESAEPSPTPAPTAAPEVIDTETDDSLYRIVSEQYPILKDYVPENLVAPDVLSNHEQTVRSELKDPIEKMFAAAAADGVSLKLVSGYRDYTEQLSLWYTYCNEYGIAYANRMDDHAGASEHQLGLAVDLGTASGNCELNACFADTDASEWLEENAYKYGFIQRYAKDTESITGIMYSPWHYRYVGTEQAEKIHASGKTMEEYYGRTSSNE